jgi:hypothetical protein
MTLAMKRLKNIGWLALVFLVAIMLYPLSLNVAAMHSDLVRVDQKILDTKREISFLQAELRTRASLQQLEEWNELLYGYKPPTAEQFLAGEHALAGLGGPAPTIKPVMVAAVDGVAPAGVIGSSSFAPMENRDSPEATEKLVPKVTPKLADASEAINQGAEKREGDSPAKPVTRRTEKLVGMDAKILSEDVMKDIEKAAKRERNKK